MNKTFTKLNELQKKLAIIAGILIILTGGYKWVDSRMISRIRQERQNRENSEKIIYEIKKVLLSSFDKLEGRYFIKLNDERISVFIIETPKGNKHIFVEDGGATIYDALYDAGKDQYYYKSKGNDVYIYKSNR